MRSHGCEVQPFLHTTAFLEDNQVIATKIQNRMPFDATTPLLGIYPREIVSQVYEGIYLSIAYNLKK